MADPSRDILGHRPQVVGGAYSSDNFEIAVAGNDHGFMLVQNMQTSYAQRVTRLFDLENADFQAYVSSRPEGQLTMANVITDLENLLTFLQLYGDVCSADVSKSIVMQIKGRGGTTGLCRAQGGSMRFTHPVIVSANLGVSIADYIVQNTMAFIFASAQSAGAASTVAAAA